MTDVWDDLFGGLDEFDKRMEQLFTGIGPDVRTYGYTMYRGPDGVPHVHEYGNAVDERPMIQGGAAREPLSDVSVDGDLVRVVVELPGVDKKDIVLEGTDMALSVSVDTPTKRFEKTLALPCRVDSDSAKASYNNGILEVTLNSEESAARGKTIPIE